MSDAYSAKYHFSEDHSCPESRLAVRSITTSPVPPASIASDPERLAMWTSSERSKPVTYIIVSGCGSEEGYHVGSTGHRIMLIPGMPPR
jgi:hypothetical protein